METYWRDFVCVNMQFEEHDAIIVYSQRGTENGCLAVKTEYWGAFPEAIEIPLLENGFHLCYIKNDNRFGVNEDLDRKARFIRYVQNLCNLKEKCVPVGMSCGGMIAVKLAARYPELMSCLYLDAPVINYMSWPCGFGRSEYKPEDQSEIMNALEVKDFSEILACREMPLDKIPILVKHKIHIIPISE